MKSKIPWNENFLNGEIMKLKISLTKKLLVSPTPGSDAMLNDYKLIGCKVIT